jgi:hypothetical protein
MLGYKKLETLLKSTVRAYMFDLPHDFHLQVDFLIEHAVLHEASLLEFLRSIRDTIELGSNFVHNSECSLANGTDSVVLGSTAPFLNVSTNR